MLSLHSLSYPNRPLSIHSKDYLPSPSRAPRANPAAHCVQVRCSTLWSCLPRWKDSKTSAPPSPTSFILAHAHTITDAPTLNRMHKRKRAHAANWQASTGKRSESAGDPGEPASSSLDSAPRPAAPNTTAAPSAPLCAPGVARRPGRRRVGCCCSWCGGGLADSDEGGGGGGGGPPVGVLEGVL
jgi:hypothetical protein